MDEAVNRAVDRVSGGMAAPVDVQVVVGAVVLGVAVAALVVVVVLALVLLRRRSAPPAPPASAAVPDRVRDDLPAFFSSPPGSPGAPVPGDPEAPPVPLGTGPGLLVPPPARATAAAAPVGRRSSAPGGYALGLIVLALLLVIAVALVGLLWTGGERPTRSSATPATTPLPSAARLTFAPVVLEHYPVGVTVSAPTVRVTSTGRTGAAHLRLPTANCLTPTAPADPEAAGCVPAGTEYADLPASALRVLRDGRTLLVRGRFPSYTLPSGGGPVYTGHVYDVAVAIRPGDGRPGSASGVLTLDGETARSTGGEQAVVRSGR